MIGHEDMKDSGLLGKLMVGTVKVNDDDPSHLRRVRVFIPELHDGIPDDHLPYFAVIRAVFRGASSGIGRFNVPQVGSKVLCIFDRGDKNSGFVIGEMEDGSSAVGGPADADYPNSYGFVDENGTYFQVDAKAGTAKFHHKGTVLTVDTAGNLTGDVAANVTLNVKGAASANITGNATVNVGGSLNVKSSGNATVDAPVIELKGGSGAAKGIVQQDCLCAFTKLPHPQVSTTVKGAI